ncbi:hypothetical protein GCM10028807_08810 [Spirosoma daeguense]
MTQKSSTDTNVRAEQHSSASSGAQRFKTIVVGVGFALLLILPTLDQILNLSAGFKSTEKRILTPFPTFQFPRVQTFIAQFGQYYKENFGWRNALFYQYSQFKYKILGTSPLPEKVVVGKNGWFYPGNSVGQIVDQHRGVSIIRTDTLASIVRNLTQLQQQLTAQGAKLYVLVAPDSYTIYPENAPENLQLKPQTSNFDRFKAYMSQHTSIPVVDVRDSLRAAKSERVIYCQTDTHWNDYGSMVATLGLVERVRQDFPKMPKPSRSDYTVQPFKGAGGDLVTMIALNREFIDTVSYRVIPATFLRTKQTETTENIEVGLPTQRFVSKSNDAPKLLLIGDSFSFSMNQFVPNYFRESYLIRTHHFDRKLFQSERPDVVVIEIVERNIGMLGQL